MNPNYSPIRPLIRCLFAAAAITATLAVGAAIDGLAQFDPDRSTSWQAAQHPTIAAAAQASR